MADVSGKFFSATKVRTGVSPSSPGSLVGETLPPVNPPGAGLSSVGLTMPSAFSVANSPLTANGSLDVTGAGTTVQYIRGDGSLAMFPSLTGFVPYTGATQNVDLGEFGIEAGFVQFDTTPTNTPTTQGTMFWDADDETVDVILNGYIMKIGEDQFYPVKNQTGSAIPKGTAVRFAGTVGASGRLLIAPFIADGSVPSSRFMGVTAEAIADGADGKVLYFGRIRGINTDAFNEGDVLYASTTVAGGFQTAVPVAPNNIVLVAAVINKSINQGVIFVRPTFGSNINEDEGVKIVSPATGQLLQLQAGGLWENKTLGQVIGGTSSQFLKGDGSLDSTTYQNTADKGQPNGYASLDSNGKVPLVQINDALIGNVNFQGLWNAATNTPTLVNPPASGTKGYYYIVDTAGTFAGITFEVGDWIISNGSAWGKVDNTDAVSSVFGRTGNVTAANGDYTTAQVTESGNLYYTDARSRSALSFVAGSGAYNSSTGVITIPTNNNQITNGAGYITSAASITGASGSLTARDNRTISPDEDNAGQLKFGFTSYANNDGFPYADYLHLRSYTDNSGGNDNLVMFLKSAIGMRIYQQSFGSSTAYSSFKDIAFTDGTNATGTWGINITGNAATANTWTTARTITIGNTGKSVNGSANVTWSLAEIGAQAALTNPVTGTGAAGRVAYFTGSTSISGEDALFWDSTNNRLGLGTTIPTNPLHIVSNEVSQLNIQALSGNTNAQINFEPTGTGIALIGPANNVAFAFRTNATERLRITSSGNLLVGTTTDNGARLQVSGTATVSNTLTGNGNEAFRLDPSSGASYMNFRIGGTSYSLIGIAGATSDIIAGSALGDLNIRATNNQKILFSTNNGGSSAMTITSSGNLLVGTTTDNGARLQVSGDIFATSQIQASSPNSGNTQMLLVRNYATSATGNFTGNYTAEIRGATNGNLTHTMNIHLQENNLARRVLDVTSLAGTVASFCSNGNVGIGRNNPSQKLDVLGSGTVYVNIENSNANIAALITKNTSKTFSTGLVTDYWAVIDSTSGSNTRLMITSGGNVLINTVTDVTDARLNVNGNIRTQAPTGGTAANWSLGTARAGTVTTNATVRVMIDGVLVDLVARYV